MAKPDKQKCDSENCTKEGLYRAPKSVDDLHSYYWFCLEHIRLYNAAWNFGKNLSPEQIEDSMRRDRFPDWRSRFAARIPYKEEHLKNQTEFFRSGELGRKKPPEVPKSLPRDVRQSLALFELDFPYDQKTLRQKYLFLVKEYHPDGRKGNIGKEERLKRVTHAYAVLRKHLTARHLE